MEARHRLLEIRDEALGVPPNLILKLENLLRERLPVHVLELATALVIRCCVDVA
mgnify:CR=1 FL=1